MKNHQNKLDNLYSKKMNHLFKVDELIELFDRNLSVVEFCEELNKLIIEKLGNIKKVY